MSSRSGQTVHVGAHQHQRAVAVLQDADDAGAAHALGDLDARGAKLLGESGRSLGFTEGELRVAVEIDEELLERGLVVHRHRLFKILVRKHR